MDTADKLHRLAEQENYEMRVIGVPKTVTTICPLPITVPVMAVRPNIWLRRSWKPGST